MISHSATTLNLAHILEQHAAKRPERTALVFNDMRFSYRQLDTLANQVAHGLNALGIGPRDHVALACPNLPYFPIAYFGILKTGAAVVALNVLLKPREIAFHLRDSDAKALLVFEGTPELPMASMAKAAFDEVPGCEHLVVMTTNPAAASPIEGASTLGRLTFNQPASYATYPTRPDE